MQRHAAAAAGEGRGWLTGAASVVVRRRTALRISEATMTNSAVPVQMSHCWMSRLVVLRRAWNGPNTVARMDRRKPSAQRGHQPRGLLLGAGVLADGHDRGEDLVEAARVQGDDLGGAAEIVQRLLDVAGGQRADPAQILG
jgi:hypothetical protein